MNAYDKEIQKLKTEYKDKNLDYQISEAYGHQGLDIYYDGKNGKREHTF